jgi:hypothetical protein
MLVNGHSYKPAVEDLVFMVIDNHVLCIVVLRCQEAIHPSRVPEAIMEHGRRVANPLRL